MDSQTDQTQTPIWISSLTSRNGLTLQDHQLKALADYVSLLLDWNSKVNLISRKDQEQVWSSHILHSLSLLFFLHLPPDIHVLDLGTGGGLPGIPLAIARPDLHFLLVDSIRKKVAAIESMLPLLPLGNVQVITSRVEELLSGPERKRRFELIVTRAVAPLEELLKWTQGLYSKQKRDIRLINNPGEPLHTPLLVALKGGDLTEEIQQARRRFPSVRIRELPLHFTGSAEAGLEEKKILIAQPSPTL